MEILEKMEYITLNNGVKNAHGRSGNISLEPGML